MIQLTTEVTETEQPVAEAPEVAENAGPVFVNNDAEVSFTMIANLIKERNAKVGKINAVKGDRQTLSEQLTESSTNPAAVEARARRDQAQEALDNAIMDLHKAIQPEIEAVVNDAEGAAKALEDEVKDLDGKIKPATSFLKKMFGEELAKHLPGLERLKGFSTKGSGTGGRRIRGYNAVVTIDGEATEFENVASAAKHLGLDTSDIQNAFFAAAGNPEALKDAPDVVEFTVKFTEAYTDGTSEEKTASVRCEREAKAESEAEVSDEAESEPTAADEV